MKHAWIFIFKMKFGKVLNFWHRKILSLISFFVYILLLYLVVSWFLWLWSHPKVSVLMNMPAEKAFKEKIVKDMMEYPCSVIWAKKHAICIWVVLIHFTKLVSAIFLKLCWEKREIWHLKTTKILYFFRKGFGPESKKRNTHKVRSS